MSNNDKHNTQWNKQAVGWKRYEKKGLTLERHLTTTTAKKMKQENSTPYPNSNINGK